MTTVSDELMTVRDWLRWAISRFNEAGLFFGHGTDNAHDEAAWLILHALHLPPDCLEPFLDARLTAVERLAVFNILQQRISRRLPAAYLAQEAWLGNFRFYVDERVIVPRSYFAGLLAEGLAPWVADPDAIEYALDLCTGSGCLAILMAHAFPAVRIDAVDISADALDVARRNVADYELQDRIRLVRSDLLNALEGCRYDLIVCNPPYVTAAAMDALPAEYRHEPALALASGTDGLDAVRRLIKDAGRHLTENGLLLVEVGHNADLVEAAFPDIPFTWIDAPGGEGKIFLVAREQLQGDWGG
ncbi:MAG: 50S ribosomal protein L3 N(5)-glutamine methyltransferase [Candidatus Nitricoxidivorans perseverans]|uniref:Ribosomal protein uL3 glutamine methyltransferase n=1 Tax=Candidatus Nitricoxidivorans perseverans TaxID=2975601 RepID=A0AA49IYZ8_9PROT|nr:MAG: 50S ribosomal protein L3 N(5)-glutamine methyltransferase [Candidatus Nitricoxidivorans perseverans]